MRDGLYAYTRRDGQVLLVQWTGGRPVEVLHAQTARRPKRLTRRRLGDSITEVVTAARLERERRAWLALVERRLDHNEGGPPEPPPLPPPLPDPPSGSGLSSPR